MILDLQLIRHGKTEAVDKMIYSGFSDLPLTEFGKTEIEAFVNQSMYCKADAYYSSGLTRAVETLKIIAGDVNWKEIAQLKECNFGDFELQKHDDLMNNPQYVEWINDQTGQYQIPNGESTREFQERVERGFQILFNDARINHNKSVLITSHGGVIGYFASKYCDNQMNFYEAMPSHGLGYRIQIRIEKSDFSVEKFSRI